MAKILFLAHRLPYPPNKGDKVRSYHLLRHLAEQHQVHLGTFVDDADDLQHLDTVRQWCAEVHSVRLYPTVAKIRSVAGLLGPQPLTLAYYRSASMQAWVASKRVDVAIVFSSSMAQFVEGFAGPVLVDFVDVDSAKWTDYADAHSWPLSWLYRREGRTLLEFERKVAAGAQQSFFVTEREATLFKSLAPECASRVQALGNGVDTGYFAPDDSRLNPYDSGELSLVFTGAMDYWPNVDAVRWFVADMLPALRVRWPRIRLSIVGRSPVPEVQALAGDAVRVTGTVPDVRPWLQHAAAVVAPLRLARGVQNKVLEAMAMGRPVVAAKPCVETIGAIAGTHVRAAISAADYIQAIDELLSEPLRAKDLGDAAREFVLLGYRWAARLSPLDARLPA